MIGAGERGRATCKRLLIAVSWCVAVWLINPASAASLDKTDMVKFLTQSLCVDASGNVTSQIPIIEHCTAMRPQRGSDRAVYRKHDWPDRRLPRYSLLAHQASDSVLQGPAGKPVVEQTFDFGDFPGRLFGRFDRSDGGQVVLLVKGWASIVMTDDSTGGVQWFISNGCKHSIERGRKSWLLFNRNTPTGRWAHVVANAGLGRSAADCPQQFNLAYTRYRRARVLFPFRIVQGSTVTDTSRVLDVVVTDHFGGAATNPASNAHLERFYFARHLGWVRWERWNNSGNSAYAADRAMLIQRAQSLSASGRCPMVDFSNSPGPGWYEVDCRMWTTIVKRTKPWSVNEYHWRAFSDTGWK